MGGGGCKGTRASEVGNTRFKIKSQLVFSFWVCVFLLFVVGRSDSVTMDTAFILIMLLSNQCPDHRTEDEHMPVSIHTVCD